MRISRSFRRKYILMLHCGDRQFLTSLIDVDSCFTIYLEHLANYLARVDYGGEYHVVVLLSFCITLHAEFYIGSWLYPIFLFGIWFVFETLLYFVTDLWRGELQIVFWATWVWLYLFDFAHVELYSS